MIELALATATARAPRKWNRAELSMIYTQGWVAVRPPDPAGHAACGETALCSAEEDSLVSTYSPPCGITFLDATMIAGNDGLDFPACGCDANEAELDAGAGLTESGAAVCPDKDSDHIIDCACPAAPPVCDGNDQCAMVHPGAPEACDSPDLDCDNAVAAAWRAHRSAARSARSSQRRRSYDDGER